MIGTPRARLLRAALGCALALCVACTSVATTNRANLQRLNLEMSSAAVVEVMGPPETKEATRTKDGRQLEILYYVTEKTPGPLTIAYGKGTPLVFLDDALIGWGEDFYRKALLDHL